MYCGGRRNPHIRRHAQRKLAEYQPHCGTAEEARLDITYISVVDKASACVGRHNLPSWLAGAYRAVDRFACEQKHNVACVHARHFLVCLSSRLGLPTRWGHVAVFYFYAKNVVCLHAARLPSSLPRAPMEAVSIRRWRPLADREQIDSPRPGSARIPTENSSDPETRRHSRRAPGLGLAVRRLVREQRFWGRGVVVKKKKKSLRVFFVVDALTAALLLPVRSALEQNRFTEQDR